MTMIQGRDATCPHCGETINLTLDPSVAEQSYVEDCPVCCRPMIVSYSAEDGEVTELQVEASD
jgi:Cysteine-rich CPXCG